MLDYFGAFHAINSSFNTRTNSIWWHSILGIQYQWPSSFAINFVIQLKADKANK
jgi:hypothetical protein